MRESCKPDGWEFIEHAVGLLDRLVADLFALPEAAEARAIAELESSPDDHGDDLVCGCWAAAEEATAQMQLMGRHLDALLQLSSIHPGYLAAAHTLGRAMTEHGLRIQWLLQPDDAAGREVRWAALKAEQARLWRRWPNFDDAVDDLERRIRAVEEHTGQQKPSGTPRIEDLAEEFTPRGRIYWLYRLMSQATHGTVVGASQFHRESRDAWLESGGEGEWIESELWAMPLMACWESATGAARRYCKLFAPSAPLQALKGEAEFLRTIQKVPPNTQARRAGGERGGVLQAPQPMNRAQRRDSARKHRRERGD